MSVVKRRTVAAVSAVAGAVTVAVGRVAAGHCDGDSPNCHSYDDGDNGGESSGGNSGDGGGIDIDINLDEVVDKLADLIDVLSDFTGSFSELMTDALFQVFWEPWLNLLHAAVNFVVFLLSWMPPTTLPEILAVHQDVFFISTGLSSIGVVVTGLAFIVYGPAGRSYSQLRRALPNLLVAVVFGAAAPWLLKPVVRLSEATALAFAPSSPDVTAMLMMSGELVVVGFLQSLVLLAVIVVLAVVKIFVAFGVAAAPLLAVLWAVPFRYTQSAADRIIGAWWAALLVGPLDMIAFRLSLALLSFDGFDAAAWVVGLAGPLLMLGLPYLLFTSGVAAAAPALATARGATQKAVQQVQNRSIDQVPAQRDELDGSPDGRRPRSNRYTTGNVLDGDEQ